jgi:lysophospholipase L1-like esterase
MPHPNSTIGKSQTRFFVMMMYRKLGLIFLITLLLLLLIEGGSYAILRAFFPARADLVLQNHLLLRYFFVPPAPEKSKDPDPIPLHALYGWRYTDTALFSGLQVDSQGFILNHRTDDAAIDPTADYRIMIIGGSTVAGSGASDNHVTIAAQLEIILEARTGKNINVINGGTGGWYSVNELAFLTQEVLPFHAPDMVIMLDGYNDMWRAALAAQQFTARTDGSVATQHDYFYDFTLRQNQQRLLNPTSAVKSGFQPEILFLTALVFGKEAPTLPDMPPLPSENAPECQSTRLDVQPYLSNVRSMLGAAQAHNVTIVYALQPIIIEKKRLTPEEQLGFRLMREKVWAGSFAAYGLPAGTCLEQVQRDFFAVAKTAFAELSASFPADDVIVTDLAALFADAAGTMFYDYAHYTDAGNRQIARYLAKLVSDF